MNATTEKNIPAEHTTIVERETNAERRDFYELLWHTGASQTDAACLTAENINWKMRTIAAAINPIKMNIVSLRIHAFQRGEKL